MGKLFYKPENAWAGDFIPFYRDGRFRLFYLHDWRDREGHGEGTPWYQISTGDFIHFEEHGPMLLRGTESEQDLYVFTGSVIEAQGIYHIFYTGHNPKLKDRGKPLEAVMHAVSRDLIKWEKLPQDTFFAPADLYEPHDWRDPFVFWNDEAGEYWMLLAARLKTGPSRRRGCTALCASKDLKSWEVREPFWAPGLYYTHECPDLFRMGDMWYLVYSTFSEKCVTHYRMSRSLKGPWLEPECDTFDGRAFYAAKTFSDGAKRYVFGWNPTKETDRDEGKWQWGGNLAVHEVVQKPDGSLTVRLPDSIEKAFEDLPPAAFSAGIGIWNIGENAVEGFAPDSFACAMAGGLPDGCMLQADLSFRENTRSCGLMLRTDEDMENAYYIRLEPDRSRMVFDMWPRRGDLPSMPELERPASLIPGKAYRLKVLIEGSVCEVYLDDQCAMSTRLYDHEKGNWGVFVVDGGVTLENVRIGRLKA